MGVQQETSSHARKCILIVDCSDSARCLVQEILGAEKYEFREAIDGQQAAAVVRTHCPDLLIIEDDLEKEDYVPERKIAGDARS